MSIETVLTTWLVLWTLSTISQWVFTLRMHHTPKDYKKAIADKDAAIQSWRDRCDDQEQAIRRLTKQIDQFNGLGPVVTGTQHE